VSVIIRVFHSSVSFILAIKFR